MTKTWHIPIVSARSTSHSDAHKATISEASASVANRVLHSPREFDEGLQAHDVPHHLKSNETAKMRDAPPRLSIDLFDSTPDEVLYLREPDTLDAQDAPAADDRLASPALPLPTSTCGNILPEAPSSDSTHTLETIAHDDPPPPSMPPPPKTSPRTHPQPWSVR